MMTIDKEEMIEMIIKEWIEEEILKISRITEEIISEEMITKSEMVHQDQISIMAQLLLWILLEANIIDLDLILVIMIDIIEIETMKENSKEEGKFKSCYN
jgi:hypothetical protein